MFSSNDYLAFYWTDTVYLSGLIYLFCIKKKSFLSELKLLLSITFNNLKLYYPEIIWIKYVQIFIKFDKISYKTEENWIKYFIYIFSRTKYFICFSYRGIFKIMFRN